MADVHSKEVRSYNMIPIKVTCALIIDELGRLFAAQRSASMKLPLKWELPGGKIEEDETPEECLIREIKEELGIEITILQRRPENRHSYPTIEIILIPFVCNIVSGKIELKEHVDFRWLTKDELLNIDWADADVPILIAYRISLN